MCEIWYLLILCAICLFTNLNTLYSEFVFDDMAAIQKNLDIRSHTPIKQLFRNDFWGMRMDNEMSHNSYRPITILTFRLNYILGGLDPFGYHIGNIIFHMLAVILFYMFLKLYFEKSTSFYIATYFSVHAVHTESIAGIVGRCELLAACFYLAVLIIYHRFNYFAFTTFSRLKDCLCLVVIECLIIIGTLCKEQCITVLAVCVSMEVFTIHRLNFAKAMSLIRFVYNDVRGRCLSKDESLMRRRLAFNRTTQRIIFLLVSNIMFLYVRIKLNGDKMPHFINFDNPASKASTPTRQFTYNYLLCYNAWLVLCPSHLLCDYSMGTIALVESVLDPRNLFTIIFYLILFYLIHCSLFQSHDSELTEKCGMALALMIFPFIPASNLFFPVGFVVAERTLYTPSIGFCFLLAFALDRCTKSKRCRDIIKICVLFLVVINAAKTYVRNDEWKDEASLFRAGLKLTQRSAKLWNNYGHVLENEGAYETALSFYVRAWEVEPSDIGPHVHIGRMMHSLNRSRDAETAYRSAVDLFPKPMQGKVIKSRAAPDHLRAFIRLSRLLWEDKARHKEALQLLDRLLSMRPSFVDAHLALGDFYTRQDNFEEALKHFKNAYRYAPEDALVLYNLAVVLLKLGREDESFIHLRNSVRIEPNNQAAVYNYGNYLLRRNDSKKYAEGKDVMLKLIETGGSHAVDAAFNLGLSASNRKQFDLAIKYYDKALSFEPTHRSSLFNMALVYYEELHDFDKALEFAEKLHKHHPDHKNCLHLMGSTYLNFKKDFKAALEMFEKAASLNETDAFSKHNVCVTLAYMKRFEEALECFERVIALDPHNKNYQKNLAALRSNLAKKGHT